VDYQRQIYNAHQWGIGYTSLLHHALGLFPFKDDFWSSSEVQPGCTQSVCQETNAKLETLVSALSTGPVAPSDKIGFLVKDLIMQTCRADGLLLQSDIPAITMDLVYSTSFNSPFLHNLTHTYSQHRINNSNSEASWHYILAGDTSIEFNITVQDIDEPSDAQFLLFEYFTTPTDVTIFDQAHPLVIPPLISTKPGTVNFKYYVLSPVFRSGEYSLIGERDKFVVASKQRLQSITSGSLTVQLEGAPQEDVHLEVFHGPTQKIESYTCKIGASGVAVLSCVENTNHVCECK